MVFNNNKKVWELQTSIKFRERFAYREREQHASLNTKEQKIKVSPNVGT